MSQKQFAMDLAKLVIVAAWADGEVQNEELNALKHLMLRIPDVTSEDWRELEIYLDHPVTDQERDALLQNVLSRITTRADKELIVDTLRELVEADGIVTDEEAELLNEVRRAVESRGMGLLGAVTGLFRRAGRSTSRPVREDRLDDYVHNPIYFRLAGLAAASDQPFSASDSVLRRACLAAGMLTLAGSGDGKLTGEVGEAIQDELVAGFGVSARDAALVAQVTTELVVEGLDAFRLGQSVRDSLDEDQRVALLDAMFRVARAPGDLVPEALDQLRRLAHALGMSRNELAAARRRSKEQSAGPPES